MTGRVLVLIGAMLLAVTACTNVPELDDEISPQLRNSRYPALIPLEDALGPPVDPQAEAQEIEEELEARAAALQNRARQLQAPQPDDGATTPDNAQ
ncbi:hypothetical protein Q5Y75_05380 [Ruegeria sp. 2205SS24-7]|uniref:hypothetical protein n=1 Tax=Ruegeria discodermiae TaxID=3064389 RepID=UPI002741CA9F|nr:hypothetical protein [Ruegeria sp. 2205SS24-7]MDP5216642.1 hypothetical protein [Ruegeria sp. 2205SS24-7]